MTLVNDKPSDVRFATVERAYYRRAMTEQVNKLPSESIEQRRVVALALLRFFHTNFLSRRFPGGIIPAQSITDAQIWLRDEEGLPWSGAELGHLANRLLAAGFLWEHGHKNSSPCFLTHLRLPLFRIPGAVWLTKVLGWRFLVHEVEALVAMVIGVKLGGDKGSGSGLVLGPRHVLTNAHVVTDMTPESILVSGSEYQIASYKNHPAIDVGIIETETDIPWKDVGVSFREPALVEPILCLGHPPIPKVKETAAIVAQSGEIVAFVPAAHDSQRYVLFSATARPGNSGGPVFGDDGSVIGLVSRSLEEQSRDDGSHRFPFFAAVPSGEVKRALEELGVPQLLQWERYEVPF